MNVTKIWDLIKRVNSHVNKNGNIHVVDVVGPGTEDQIKIIERELEISLCADYKDFILEFGVINYCRDESIEGAFKIDDERYEGVVVETKEFFEKVYKSVIPNTTVLVNIHEEWYVLLNHSTGITTPYDPFSKEFVTHRNEPFEEFIISTIESYLEF